MRSLILALVLLPFGAFALQAQRLSDRAAMAHTSPSDIAAPPRPTHVVALEGARTGSLKGGGLFGALLMGGIGGFIGSSVARPCGDGMCELGGLIGGFLVGEIVGVPLGVRMAGGRGSLPTQMLVSGGTLALGLMAVPVTAGLSLLAVVPIQVELVVRNAQRDTTRIDMR